ncbi:phosphatase PAP2 family protein [Serratia sp. 2723]|uniref:phosphatase PAP2 family protein n=1 Tax=unclassified Serratia (in: enterobacteria) TaxID=2647522 RepID=UPI003D206A1F
MNSRIEHDEGTAMHGVKLSHRCYLGAIALILMSGIVSAIRLEDSQFIIPGVFGLLALCLLFKATYARSERWKSWLGVIQFANSWLVFPLFKAIHLATRRSFDSELLALDRALFAGVGATERARVLENYWLSEILSLCYLAFYLLILVPVIVYAVKRKTQASRGFFYGLMLMYLFGFIGYCLIPAAGPYLQFPELFTYPPQGGTITGFLVSLVAQGGTGMDVFPSLHCGISLYILGYLMLQRHCWIALLILPVVAGLVLATLYLRYHYGIDLIAGALLACSVLAWLRYCGYFPNDAKLRI